MTTVISLTQGEVWNAARSLADKISGKMVVPQGFELKLWGVPKGGVPVSYLLTSTLYPVPTRLVENPEEADVIVDDLVDSGSTLSEYQSLHPNKIFGVLFNKSNHANKKILYGKKQNSDTWISFPWERSDTGIDCSAEDVVTRFLQFIGENPLREGLLETPRRAVKAWQEWYDGYGKDPDSILKSFEDGAENYDQMVLVRDIPVISTCEHHIAPFFGVAHVAYVPKKRIVGISKVSRLVDIFAHRLQVQERLTNQVADSLVKGLNPKGVAVMFRCRHLCMESRGIKRAKIETVTTALRGCLKRAEGREEFLKSVSLR